MARLYHCYSTCLPVEGIVSFVDEISSVLECTPAVLDALLTGLPDKLIRATEGPDTWSAYDVIGHLIHGEQTDWIPRLEIILRHGVSRPFDPFDREAQKHADQTRPLAALLDEFRAIRESNLARLRALALTPEQLDSKGMHPALGVVTARQLLATWTAHDLAHLVQINRTLARQYKQEVGPWAQFLSVMK